MVEEAEDPLIEAAPGAVRLVTAARGTKRAHDVLIVNVLIDFDDFSKINLSNYRRGRGS
jgi:hypothetical protein